MTWVAVCWACGGTNHTQVDKHPVRYRCNGCGWLWFEIRCKVPGCNAPSQPGSKVCDAHLLHQCPALHSSKYSGSLGFKGPHWHRQCWNLVKMPGALCHKHRR